MVDLLNYGLLRRGGSTCSRLGLDLQDGGVMVEDGQDDFVHVLPQTQVNLLLLFQSIDQLGDTQRKKRLQNQSSGFVRHYTLHPSHCSRPTSSLEALSISAARHWALVLTGKQASYRLKLRIWAFRSSFWSRSLWFSCGNKPLTAARRKFQLGNAKYQMHGAQAHLFQLCIF